MADFVDDYTDPPETKVDATAVAAGASTTKYIRAADINNLSAAAASLRTSLLGGKMHGLRETGVAPTAVDGLSQLFTVGSKLQALEPTGSARRVFPTGIVYLNDLGGDSTGTTDSTAAFNAFFAGVLAGTMRKLFIPRGTYLTTGLSFDAVGNSFVIEGEDGGTIGVNSGTRIKYTGTSGGSVLRGSGWTSVHIHGINFDGNGLASKLLHIDSVKADGVSLSASYDVQVFRCGFFRLKTSDTASICVAIGNSGAGANYQASEVRVSNCVFRGNEFTNTSAPYGTGVQNLTGGNCKNFWVNNCNITLLNTGVKFSTSGTSMGEVSSNYFGTISTAIDSTLMQLTVQNNGMEVEAGTITAGARFLVGTSTNAPSAALVRANYVATICPSDDLGIIWNGGTLELIGNDFWNKRTSDFAHPFKVQAWALNLSIADGTGQPGSLTSKGNWYRGVQPNNTGQRAYAPIYDPGGSNFFTALNGMRRTGTRAESVGDWSYDASGIAYALQDCLPLAEIRGNALVYSLPARPLSGGTPGVADIATVLGTDIASLVGSGTTVTLQVSTIPMGWRVRGLYVEVVAPFVAPGMTTLTLKLGTPADDDLFLVAAQLVGVTAGTVYGNADADMGVGLARATQVQGGYLISLTADTNVNMKLTADADIHGITAGKLVLRWIVDRVS